MNVLRNFVLKQGARDASGLSTFHLVALCDFINESRQHGARAEIAQSRYWHVLVCKTFDALHADALKIDQHLFPRARP